MVRDAYEQRIRRRRLLAVGTGAGLGLVAGGTVGAWMLRQGDGTTVAVLGSGTEVSVLVRHERRAVLIAAGDDAAMFAEALGTAQPILTPDIDLVLIASEAHERLIDKAVSGARDQVWLLPGETGDRAWPVVMDTFSMAFGDDLQVSVQPRKQAWEAGVAWGGSDRVVIVPRGSMLRGTAAIAVVLDGSAGPEHAGQTVIGPRVESEAEGYLGVEPGRVLRIRLSAKESRVER